VLLVTMVLPVVLLRTKLDEIPAIGDIRSLLPRERGELKFGAGLALTAGVVEELLFRLALPALLFGVFGSGIVAFTVAALVFGLLHIYQGPQGMLFAFLLGVVFTALYLLSGTIVVPIVLHALIDLRSLVLIPVALGSAWHEPRAASNVG
jgi:membrane protease YdiL (CAAX protease family)